MFTQSMYDTHGQPLNLAEWLEYFAYDAASAMVLGTRFGFMEKHGDINGTLSQLKQGFRYATIIGQVPEWHPWLLGNRILATFLQKHTSFPDPTVEILQMVTERLQAWNEEQHAQQNNILTWLQVGQKTANKLSQTDIVNNLFTYVAGSAAISTSLGAVFYYLLKHPSAYCKLVKEIQGRDKSGYISSYITSSQSKEMPYLQAVLKEAMRLAPSVALPLDRCVPPAGATICGHYLPGGTNVSMCAAVVHQDTTIYGDDAAAFSPERWLNATPDAKRAMELHFFAFGKGGRACVGKDLAMLQMEKFLMEILERFDVEWAAEEKDWKVKNFWLPEYYGLLVRLKARVT